MAALEASVAAAKQNRPDEADGNGDGAAPKKKGKAAPKKKAKAKA
jgi:hypothetical protein